MKVFIDADGCPVVDITVRLAGGAGVDCVILCDTAHEIKREGARTITVSKGADSVDFALVNLLSPGDIAITQDYGLAAMCLSRRGIPMNQDGLVYTEENINSLLDARYYSQKARRAGARTRGPRKRTEQQNAGFEKSLAALLSSCREAEDGGERP